MGKSRKKNTKEEFICNVCGIQLSSSYNLRIHTETKCSTLKNHICDICDAKFLTSHSLKTHLNSLHFGDKKFVCSFCAKSFLSKGIIVTILYSTILYFIRLIIKLLFFPGQLKVHERSHTKEKAFVCTVSTHFIKKCHSFEFFLIFRFVKKDLATEKA